ncbi:hypothetical protein QAD02_013210 [Eretmocerus hayati]|uniref:Uncharacterized protein n=1 Tax=Eretmocerus hayati TaxID=131215 RepID=A0ACC2P1S5_9HYME|nr:hypothetical protein QAD02_013210 [Eretmocerus hayati]
MLARAPFNSPDIQYHRIGKEAVDIPRPVKLILQTAGDAKWILRNQKKFCSCSIRCASDKTQAQLQRILPIAQRLEERRKEGEQNIAIKYVRGILSIIKTKATHQDDRTNAPTAPSTNNSSDFTTPTAIPLEQEPSDEGCLLLAYKSDVLPE